jgi:hypothetical protein
MRAEFTKDTKLEAWQRAHDAEGVPRCEKCTARLMPGKFHYDHINPDAFSHDGSLGNCQVLCVACHDKKTGGRDVPAIAKSNRVRLRHAGIRKDRTIRAWRSFDGKPVFRFRQRD